MGLINDVEQLKLFRLMKKILFVLSALVVFAVGCSKNDIDTPETKYDLVVNINKPSFGDDTRASRNSWEDGDEVTLFFGRDFLQSKWLVLTYQNGKWSPKDVGWFNGYVNELANKDDKSLAAVYCSIPGNVDLANTKSDGTGTEYVGRWESSENGMLVMFCKDGSFEVDSVNGIIEINATLVPKSDKYSFVQFTIRNISAETDNWTLDVDGRPVQVCKDFVLQINNEDELELNFVVYDMGSLMGYRNQDGVAFYGLIPNSELGVSNDYTFTLTNGRNALYTKTFEGKTLNAGDAVIFNGPAYGNDYGWEKE